jgi:hypothetical protein
MGKVLARENIYPARFAKMFRWEISGRWTLAATGRGTRESKKSLSPAAGSPTMRHLPAL